jgi:hypothetical protein
MKPLLSLLAISSLLFASPAKAGDEVDAHLTKQISSLLADSRKLVPGSTRADLLKAFTTEGGLSTAKHRVFVHRRCPYVKVEVDFTLSDPAQNVLDERATDIISKISKPYLELSIED